MADKTQKGVEVQSAKEYQLIQELVKTRMESNRELAYESFDDYEVPPSTQFPMLKKPAVTIKHGKMVFNMAAIRLFSGVKDVLPMVNSKKKRFAIVPCAEEELSSVEWARKRQRDEVWVNKDITSHDFTEKIFNLMGWNKECRYKVLGRLANSDRGLILVFELREGIMFEPKKEEYVDPVSGEIKKRQIKYYPDFYKNRIGRSYDDYAQAQQMSMFEKTDSYADGVQLARNDSGEEDAGLAETADTPIIETETLDGYQKRNELTMEPAAPKTIPAK